MRHVIMGVIQPVTEVVLTWRNCSFTQDTIMTLPERSLNWNIVFLVIDIDYIISQLYRTK